MDKEGSNIVKTYDISIPTCPLLATKRLRISDVDVCMCMCMIHVLPSEASQALRPVGTKDFRGNFSTPYLQEIIAMGMSSGSLVFADTLADLDIICTHQVHMSAVDSMIYRREHKDIITFSFDTTGENTLLVKMWQLPSMTCTNTYSSNTTLNATFWAVSNVENLLGIGQKDGNFRMFSFVKPVDEATPTSTKKQEHKDKDSYTAKPFIEMEVVTHHHDAAITSISFMENIKAVVTCAFDSSVRRLIFFDYHHHHYYYYHHLHHYHHNHYYHHHSRLYRYFTVDVLGLQEAKSSNDYF